MRQERRELAARHYPVTEQGLLARFNPHPQTSSHTSPSTKEHRKAEPDYFEPASVETPSTPLLDLPVSQHLISPSSVMSVSSVDVNGSSNLPDQDPVSAVVSDFQGQMSTNSPQLLPTGGTNALMGVMGRGRPLPSIGRGFPLQNVRETITPARMGMAPSCLSHSLTQMPTPQHGCYDDNLPKDIHGMKGEHLSPNTQSVALSLVQSFRSFRY